MNLQHLKAPGYIHGLVTFMDHKGSSSVKTCVILTENLHVVNKKNVQ